MIGPGAEDVTLGEVYRLVLGIITRLDRMAEQSVARTEYESDQTGHVEAHRESGRRIEDARTETKELIAAAIKSLRVEVADLKRSIRWWAGGAGALALALIVFALPHIHWQ